MEVVFCRRLRLCRREWEGVFLFSVIYIAYVFFLFVEVEVVGKRNLILRFEVRIRIFISGFFRLYIGVY